MRAGLGCASIVLLCAVPAARPAEHPFQDPDRAAEDRITDLVGRMTLEEKTDCLAMRSAPAEGRVVSPARGPGEATHYP
jgi:hypothetical protein